MTVLVKVMLKSGVLDPQGKAIADALHRLSYTAVSDVRAGKLYRTRSTPRTRGTPSRSARRWRRNSSRTPS